MRRLEIYFLAATIVCCAFAAPDDGAFSDGDRDDQDGVPILRLSGEHTLPIYALTFVGDGVLASGAKDRSIVIWNISGAVGARGLRIHKLEGHRAGITALVHVTSRGGRDLLVSGSADNTSAVWDVRTGEILTEMQHPRTVFGVAVRPSAGDEHETEVATACWDGVVRVFQMFSIVPRVELHGHAGGLYSVAYSPLDGSLLASASADRTVRVWDMTTGEVLCILGPHRDHVISVDWSPTQPLTLASGGWDRTMRLWKADENDFEVCREAGSCSSHAFANLFSGKHPQLVWRVVFAPGGELVAACHGAVGQSPTVVIYSVATGKVFRSLGRHRDTPLVIAWSPSGAMIASAGMDQQVLVYDGQSTLNDIPQGDRDDAGERLEWRMDLKEFITGQPRQNLSDVNRSDSSDEYPLPHPLANRGIFM